MPREVAFVTDSPAPGLSEPPRSIGEAAAPAGLVFVKSSPLPSQRCGCQLSLLSWMWATPSLMGEGH